MPYLLTNIISQNIKHVCYLLANIISQNIKNYNFFHQGILATKLKYYGYTYGELVEQMLDESAPTPHIDITSSALRLLLNFPIGVLKTKYQSSTKTRAKKVWEAYWYFSLDADSHLEFLKIHVVLVDNNEGFVAPAVPYCQNELHEEFTIAISALDDAKDSFKSPTKLVPEGSEIHQAHADQHANQNSIQPFQVCKHCNRYSRCNSWQI